MVCKVVVMVRSVCRFCTLGDCNGSTEHGRALNAAVRPRLTARALRELGSAPPQSAATFRVVAARRESRAPVWVGNSPAGRVVPYIHSLTAGMLRWLNLPGARGAACRGTLLLKSIWRAQTTAHSDLFLGTKLRSL